MKSLNLIPIANWKRIFNKSFYAIVVFVAALVVGCGESSHIRSGLYEDLRVISSMLNRFERHEGRRPHSRKELLSFFDSGYGSDLDFEYIVVDGEEYVFVWEGDTVLLRAGGGIFLLRNTDVDDAVKELEGGAKIKDLELVPIQP